jgi:hypothetical protein
MMCGSNHKKYMHRHNVDNEFCGQSQSSVEDKTLNDMESSLYHAREPVYDDTYRINNEMFWMSDYSQPGQDAKASLNDDIITPIRPVSGSAALNYLSGLHHVSRFGCEKSV